MEIQLPQCGTEKGARMAVTIKPERIMRGTYPDLALLERLKDTFLVDANIPEHEFLQFRRIQNLIYSLRVAGFDIEAMQTEAYIGAVKFTNVNCKVAVTRCEYDFEINTEELRNISARLPPETIMWLTTNANVIHPRIQAFPIGITDYCGYSPYHAVIGDTEKLKNHIDSQPRTQKNLVLMNFNDYTNLQIRFPVRKIFEGKDFVTSDTYAPSAAGYTKYVQGLRSHPFCLSPRGNGIDTHRTWECLYAGCIPIVQKTDALREFKDLPILFVDQWRDVSDASILIKIRDEYYQKKWDLRKLTLSYWYQYICKLLGTELSLNLGDHRDPAAARH
jgi:Exostosin family